MTSLPQLFTTYTMRANKRIDSYPIQPRGRGRTGPFILFVRFRRNMHRDRILLSALIVSAVFGHSFALLNAAEPEDRTNQVGTIVRSFYELPDNTTVLKKWPGSTGGILGHLKKNGI